MVDIADIIGLLGSEGDGESSTTTPDAISGAKVFLQGLYDYIEAQEEESEPGKPDYLRASSLHRLCPRATAVATIFPELIPSGEKFSAGQRFTFDLGHAMHAWFQNQYIGPMGNLWGHWFCFKCDRIVHTGLMPKKCRGCGRGRSLWHAYEYEGRVERFKIDNFLYVERSLVDSELGLTAHPDGLIYAPSLRDIQQVFELKTISTDGLDKLVKADEPKPDHVIQTHAYMHLTGLRETYILYFDKGKQCEWTFDKEKGILPGDERCAIFHIEFDDDLWADLVAKIREYWRARTIKKKAEIASFPRPCKTPTGRTARECPYRDKCFTLRAPRPAKKADK